MERWLHLSLVVALLTLGGAVAGSTSATAEQASTTVGVVVNEDGNSLALIDPAAGRAISSDDLGGAFDAPHLAAFDPAGRRLYVGTKSGSLVVVDVTDSVAPKLVERVMPGEPTEIHWLALADGLVWLADEGESAVYAYDPADLSEPEVVLGRDEGFDTPHGLALRPGTRELWITNRPKEAPGFVLRVDARERAVIGEPLETTGAAGDRPNNVGFTPDGRWGYAVNTGGKATQVTVIDAETFAVETQVEQHPTQGLAPHAIAFHPGTGCMFVANKDGGTVSAIDVATNEVVGYVAVGEEPHGVGVGPDGRVYATAKGSNRVAVIDPERLEVVAEIEDPALAGPHQIVFLGDTATMGTPTVSTPST